MRPEVDPPGRGGRGGGDLTDFPPPTSALFPSPTLQGRPTRPMSSTEVDRWLATGKASEALVTALESSGDASSAVLKVLTSVKKDADVDASLSSLGADNVDALVKHLYAGLALGDAAISAACLRWHERVVNAHGLGGIVRHLSAKDVSASEQ